jgi:hypothetical protein
MQAECATNQLYDPCSSFSGLKLQRIYFPEIIYLIAKVYMNVFRSIISYKVLKILEKSI